MEAMLYTILTRLGLDNLALATPRAKAIMALEEYQKPFIKHLMKIYLYPSKKDSIKVWKNEIATKWIIPALLIEVDKKPIKPKLLEDYLLPVLDKDNTKRKMNLLIDHLTTKPKNPFPEPKGYSVNEFLEKYEIFRKHTLKAIKKNTIFKRENVEVLIERYFITA